MENQTQITLNDRERWLIAQLFAVATAFLANIYGDQPIDIEDAKIIQRLNIPSEIEALTIKLNLDKFRNGQQ